MVQVKVKEGILEGEELENDFGGKIFSFKGIPYAQPPVGDLRFKAPRPPKPWSGVRNAKDHGPRCYQVDMFFNTATGGSEDCLYLDVYSPNLKPNKPLPVMFWIHGGGFVSGNSNSEIYGPEFLVRKDVILVTINYRLDIFGFLCLHTPEVPGNAGMKDQVAALRWVNKNISSFGGEPNNITIFGESAGGASVTYHLLSPMSKGLFKRAISQSGSANNSWAICHEPRETAKAVARKLGLDSDDDKELYDFFIKQPTDRLVNAKVFTTLSAAAQGITTKPPFCIVDEKKFGDNERFFFGNPWDAFRNGIHEDVEVMSGYCKDESLVIFAGVESIDKFIENVNSYLELFIPDDMRLNLPMNTILEVGKKVRKFYLGNKTASSKTIDKILQFMTMIHFTYENIQWLKMASAKNKVYLYKFTCITERNILGHIFMKFSEYVRGKPLVSHADDLTYLFPMNVLKVPVDKNSETFKLIDRCCQLWTNFAKYGNPTPDSSLGASWKPYDVKYQSYLEIGNQLAAGHNVDAEEMEFWENLYKEYLPQHVA